jgi:hypothetical protein
MGEKCGRSPLLSASSSVDHPSLPRLLHAVGLAVGDDDNAVVDERSSKLTAVVCSGRKRPHWLKGQWLAMPRTTRS